MGGFNLPPGIPDWLAGNPKFLAALKAKMASGQSAGYTSGGGESWQYNPDGTGVVVPSRATCSRQRSPYSSWDEIFMIEGSLNLYRDVKIWGRRRETGETESQGFPDWQYRTRTDPVRLSPVRSSLTALNRGSE